MMHPDYTTLVDKCRPLTIARDDLPNWGKIGGIPPEGVRPDTITELTRFFATIKTGRPDQSELSLFISTVYDRSSPVSMLTNRNRMHSRDNSLVQFVFHKPSPRGEDESLASELSAHGLIIEDEQPDSDDREKNIIWNHHKIGGYPFFTQDRKLIAEQCQTLRREGYFHLVQFAFPDAQDGRIRGSWPFADFVFHAFSKEVGGEIDFRYCWG